jgi:hypothetical protein
VSSSLNWSSTVLWPVAIIASQSPIVSAHYHLR